CRHDPTAEMEHPDAVDEHSRRQRLLATGQPAGVSQAPAGSRNRWIIARHRTSIACAEDRQLAGLHLLSRLVYVATEEDKRLWDLAGRLGKAGNKVLGGALCLHFLLAGVEVFVERI